MKKAMRGQIYRLGLVITNVGNQRDEICNNHRERKNDRWV
jgi:hypothetical protein